MRKERRAVCLYARLGEGENRNFRIGVKYEVIPRAENMLVRQYSLSQEGEYSRLRSDKTL